MRYYIEVCGNEKNTADMKAPADMCAVMKARGYRAIPFRRPKKGRLHGIRTHFLNWRRAYRAVKPGDLVVYQYPLLLSHYCVRMLSRLGQARKATVVLLLHDIDSIRGLHREDNAWKEKVFESADFLICHNEKMAEWLRAHGVRKEIVPLGIFDYLAEERKPGPGEDENAVILAGNLSETKSPYIGKLLALDRKVPVHLYGPYFEEKAAYRNYRYFGSFPPEELKDHLQGGFGLVWDGDSLEECSGMTGQYLRWNNPHKVSLYISAGIPVIIWKEAALAPYIESNGLGITLDSLRNLDAAVSSLPPEKRAEIRENVRREGEKLRRGEYLNRALDRIEQAAAR